MKDQRNTRYYAKILAKRLNISESKAYKICVYGMKNIVKILEEGEDIRIPGFGHIYVDKKVKLKNREKRNNDKPKHE